jgi:hypothetical protein
MDNQQITLKRRIQQGWAMVGLGVLLLLVGIGLHALFPHSVMNFKWVEGFGVMAIGWGAIYLARYLIASRSPVMARRTIVEDNDERNIAIRNQAGNAAFLFTTLASSFALIIYSAMTRGQAADALWLYMACVVIVPSVFYVAYLVWARGR